MRWALIFSLLSAYPARAQTQLDARAEAQRFHEIGGPTLLAGFMHVGKAVAIAHFLQAGRSQALAVALAERVVMPALEEKLPTLEVLARDLVTELFTVEELHSINYKERGPALNTAALKVHVMLQRLRSPVVEWANQIRQDAMIENVSLVRQLEAEVKP